MPENQKYAFAKVTAIFGYSGGTARVKRGQVWFSDHPAVKEKPEFFSEDPVVVHGGEIPEHPVEDTTAEPGKKRRTK